MVDIEKYNKIVRKYTQPLYKYCYKRLHKDKQLAEDTVIDIMDVLRQKWDKLDIGENIRAWLYRVADNCIKHSLRKYDDFYSNNTSLEEKLENHPVEGIQCYDEYFSDENSEEEYIKRIIAALPDEYKEIFRLRYIEKKTIKETAELVKMPYTSVHLRLTKIEPLVREEIRKIFH